MRLKLDENLGRAAARLLVDAGHDVATVTDQGLAGVSDARLFEVCAGERRCLVTLDLDFANTLSFDPAATAGVAVLRVPALPGQAAVLACVRCLARQLVSADITGWLWIVDEGRVRQWEPEAP